MHGQQTLQGVCAELEGFRPVEDPGIYLQNLCFSYVFFLLNKIMVLELDCR